MTGVQTCALPIYYLKPVSQEIGKALRRKKIRYTNISIRNSAIVFTLKENKAVDLSSGIPLGRQLIPIKFSVDLKTQDEKYYLVFKLDDKSISNIASNHYKRTMYIIKKRADIDRKSTRLNSSHTDISRMPSSA